MESGEPDDVLAGTAATVASDPHAVTGDAPTLMQAGGDTPVTRRHGDAPSLPARESRPLRSAPLAGGRYQVGERIGRGGMGEVLVAFDEHVGRDVAVKRIRQADPSDEARARFVREARIQGQLEHPTIVPVHDVAVDIDGRPYFVMKRVTGVTLGHLLAEHHVGSEPARRARVRLLRAFVDVCLAIEFAHRQSIIHRDLKPANIMLGDFGEVYVLDWGLARGVDVLGEVSPTPAPIADVPSRPEHLQLDTGETQEGAIMGTPGYMAPEQMVGERIGPPADIYALGCLLFEIATGETLHREGANLVGAIMGVDARPSSRRPEIGPELDAICVRATALAPAERFASARGLADAVQEYLDGDRDLARRRELAIGHVAAARAALAGADDAIARTTAMREAGRALALDPTATEAADVVTQLMLTPPTVMPPEVQARLEQVDIVTGRTQGRMALLALLGYAIFVPVLIWTGLRDVRFLLGIVGLALLNGAVVVAMMRRNEVPLREIYMSAVINALLLALVTRIVGPFIVVPSLAASIMIAYASHPRFGRLRIVGPVLATGILIPWGLELAGVLPPTYNFVDGQLVLRSQVIQFSAAPVQGALLLLLVVQMFQVAVLSRRVAEQQHKVSQQLELQAWQLRQLMPRNDKPS